MYKLETRAVEKEDKIKSFLLGGNAELLEDLKGH